MTRLLFFCTILFFTTTASAQQAGSMANLSSDGPSRTSTIDVQHIAIDLRFDWHKRQAYGTTTLTLSLLAPTRTFTLDAGMLAINSVVLANGTALTFHYDGGDKNDGLEIVLDKTYPANENITVQIDYRTNWVNETDPNNLGGSNGKGLRFLAPTAAEPKKRKQLWSMGEPESNRYWFPGRDTPGDLRTSEFRATVEPDLTVISNGVLVETKKNADGTRTFHYKMDIPYANHLTAFVAGEYVDVKQHYGDIPLHNYCYPDEVEATAASVERLPDMVKFFSEITGVKYPYPAYSQIFVQDLPWGMAGITASTQTENMVDDYGTHADFLYLWDGLEGEMLAQQWFGNYLTCKSWNDVWLNKSFARYFSGLYNAHKNGRAEYLIWQHAFDQSTYLFDWNSGIRQPILNQSYESDLTLINGNHPYFHGASVLHLLHKHLGDDQWRKAIQQYVKTNANQLVTTEDFQKAVEAASGESMGWFFEQWLYKMGHPIFAVTKHYDAAKKQLTLWVKQTQQLDTAATYPQVAFFQGKIDVEIDNRIEQVWLAPKAENVFVFPCPEQPRLVNFDYESAWIKEITFEKPVEELCYQIQNDADVLGRQWAMGELVRLAQHEKTSAAEKDKIYAAFRAVMLSDVYWRVRLNALSQLQRLLVPAQATEPAVLDPVTTSLLLTVIEKDQSWLRAGAIRFLGMTRDAKYSDIYLRALKDPSDRVINSAAIALGKCKSPKAYSALVTLKDKPSWKNQSLMSALSGLKELGDPRGVDVAFEALSDLNLSRWFLPTPPVWDVRIIAAETITALGKGDLAYPLIFGRFKQSLEENDLNVIFNHALLIATLADPRGQEAFDLLRARFKDDANALPAVDMFEAQFKAALNKP